MKNQTPIKSWKKLQLSLFSRGMLYAVSSGVHLFGITVYFLILSQEGVSPYGYYNPSLWNAFYGVWIIIAGILFWHGLRTLIRGYKALPEYLEEVDNRGYQTETIDRT